MTVSWCLNLKLPTRIVNNTEEKLTHTLNSTGQQLLISKDLITNGFELHSILLCNHNEPGLVVEYLQNCGLEVTEGVALTGVIGILDSGKPGKTLVLRTDMDCLRVTELTGCDYQSQNERCTHACGHNPEYLPIYQSHCAQKVFSKLQPAPVLWLASQGKAYRIEKPDYRKKSV